MENKFQKNDKVVYIGTTKPVMTVVEIIDRNNSTTNNLNNVKSGPLYRCSYMDEGNPKFEDDDMNREKELEEDEIEVFPAG
jgi:hypothetical protein